MCNQIRFLIKIFLTPLEFPGPWLAAEKDSIFDILISVVYTSKQCTYVQFQQKAIHKGTINFNT